MPQKVLKFAGINMNVDEFQNSGACEELINLRPDSRGRQRIVRSKKKEHVGVDYDMYYEHSFGETSNVIIVENGVVRWIANDSKISTVTNEFASKNVSICHAGNVLVVYCEDTNEQRVFEFKDGSYSSFDFFINNIVDAKIRYSYDSTLTALNKATAEAENEGAFNEALAKASSGFYAKYPSGLAGVSIIGCAYELEDGSEIWSTSFVVANTTNLLFYREPVIKSGDDISITIYGADKIHLDLTFAGTKSERVKAINIYASRPVFPYEIKFVSFDGGERYEAVKTTLEDQSLEGQVMYFVGKVSPNEKSASLLLKLGDIAGNNIMDVNTGCTSRVGRSVSYNNRFHYYRSTVEHVIQIPTSSQEYDQSVSGSDTPYSYWIAYVKINEQWKVINKVYKFRADTGSFADEFNKTHDIVYPMMDVSEIRFIKGTMQNDITFSTTYSEMFSVKLKNSTAYNYSYAFDVTPEITSVGSFYSEIQKANQLWGSFDKTVLLKNDVNAINITAPFNPYVFPVKYSYGFGGEIIDISTSYLPISSTQAGQYPIAVFTKNGVYALEQGNGDVLYSNIVPLQPQVIDGKATTTPYGTFFVSSNSLYMLVGRDTINISQVLDGDRELRLRDNDAYQKLCCTKRSILYDFSELLSKEDFSEFISDVSMVYDQFNNEIIISSNKADIRYSYVFNLNTKSFHKINKKYLGTQNGSRYAIEISGDSRNIVDMHTEIEVDDQPILLQSRPLNLEAFGTHIQRLIMLLDTKLTGDQYLFVSVFGSDNLYDWDCIISAQKHDTALRQIRTNRAARTYRDYIILINGVVSTDTDLSEIIADYTVVSRRLG